MKKAASKKPKKPVKVVETVKKAVKKVMSAGNKADKPTVTTTVAPPPVAPPIRPPEPEVTVAPNDPERPLPEITREAWNAVRNPDDAPFETCDPSFRAQLLHHAESVVKTRAVLDGDAPIARFEREIAKLVN